MSPQDRSDFEDQKNEEEKKESSKPQFFVAKKESKVIAEHTLTAEETLSHISLKYYGHATEPYWRVIYEANKEIIGDNPNHVRAGLELKIPELPASLKDK